MNKTTEKIPTWSLCYLTGGDRAGLTEEEVRLIDKWTSDWQVQIVSPLTDMDGNAQPYFSYCNKQILNRHFSVKLNHHLIIETTSLYY